MTARTDRNLPAPWALCDMCGKTAGVLSVLHPDTVLCPACTRWELLNDAATDSLRDMISPILGAWVAQWSAAGVSLEDLEAATEYLSGSNLCSSAGHGHRRSHLRRLRLEHRALPFEIQPSDRVELSADELPTLCTYHPADQRRGWEAPFFKDTNGKAHTLPKGLDTLTVTLPDGDALLIFTGMNGWANFRTREGFRVPAALLPQVRAALAGEK